MYAKTAKEIASFNSFSFNKVFKVKFTFTFLNFAYSIASFKFSLLKFVALALALKLLAPRYTVFAPFCTAAFKHSKSPTGESNSGTFIKLLFLFLFKIDYYYSIINIKLQIIKI